MPPDKRPRSLIPVLVVGMVLILAMLLVVQMVKTAGYRWLNWASGTGTIVLLAAEAALVVGAVLLLARRRK